MDAAPYSSVCEEDFMVFSAAYSPDGCWTAFGGSSSQDPGHISVRESKGDQETHRLQHNHVTSLVFSPDSTRLLSGSYGSYDYDKTASVWEFASGECLSELKHPKPVFTVAWSPDDTFFLTGCADNRVRMWDATTYQCLYTLNEHPVWSLAISPDSSFFVSGGSDAIAIVWDVRPDEAPREARRLQGHTAGVHGVATSPDNTRIGASGDHEVKMWSVTGDELWSSDLGMRATCIAFSPGGRLLAVGVSIEMNEVGPDGIEFFPPSPVLILDAGTGVEVARFAEHCESVYCVAYHPLGHTLLSGSQDCTVRKWTLPQFLVDPPSL